MVNLSYGSKGDSVKQLQQQLVDKGYNISVDGIYGNQTKNAVMQYQKANGLSVDGIAGNQTFGSLGKVVQASSSPSVPTPAPAIQQNSAPAQTTNNYGYNEDAEMSKVTGILGQQRDAQVQSATAELDAKLASDIANLQKAYDQAVADGQISVRDAESQFADAKSQLEEQYYKDSQSTLAYGQDMGIQNSQQQVGLMQSDQARNAKLVNQNISTRDKRINDIKDRINQLTKEKDVTIANAKSQHDSDVIQAKANADADYSQKLFGVTEANRQAKQQQAYQKEQMDIQFQNSLKSMQEESKLRISEMNVQHGLDLEKMAKDLENSIKLEATKYGYQSKLQSQAAKQAQAQAVASAKAEMEAEQKAYETARARELSKYTPGTPEYSIRASQLEDAYKTNLANIHAGTVYDAISKSILNDPALTKPSDPNAGKIIGSSKAAQQYQLDLDSYYNAINRKNDFLSNPSSYIPSPYNTNTSTKSSSKPFTGIWTP